MNPDQAKLLQGHADLEAERLGDKKKIAEYGGGRKGRRALAAEKARAVRKRARRLGLS